MVTSKDICRQICTGYVTKMKRTIGIRPSYTNVDIFRHKPNPQIVLRDFCGKESEYLLTLFLKISSVALIQAAVNTATLLFVFLLLSTQISLSMFYDALTKITVQLA